MPKHNTAQNKEKLLTVGTFASKYGWASYHFFPMLRLQGKWLKNHGFVAGQKCKVEPHGNGILITPLND